MACNYKFVAKYCDDGDEINNKNSHRFHNYNRNAKGEQSVAIFANQHPTLTRHRRQQQKQETWPNFLQNKNQTHTLTHTLTLRQSGKPQRKHFLFVTFILFFFWCVVILPLLEQSSGIVSAITSHKEIKKRERERNERKKTKKGRAHKSQRLRCDSGDKEVAIRRQIIRVASGSLLSSSERHFSGGS